MSSNKISVLDLDIKVDKNNYISLTDIAKKKNSNDPRDVIRTWMRSKSTIQFLGFWGKFNNSSFKEGEFNRFKMENSGNYSSIFPTSWIQRTNARGIFSILGRYNSGTYAHRDVANVTQLVCLSNLESLNSVLISERVSQKDRLERLNQIAISQMKILVKNIQVKSLEEKEK